MSLIHWWPLNGDLKDYGNSNSVLKVLYGSPSFTTGKIGKCSNLTSGEAYYIDESMPCNSVTGYSVTAWVYFSSLDSGHRSAIWSNRDGGPVYSSCEIYNNKLHFYHYNGSWQSSFGHTTLVAGRWYHVAFVIKDRRVTFYLDGIFDGDGDATLSGDNQNLCDSVGCSWYSGYALNGYLNDVRVYDHALSTKEVKEISKGLVLHYNFEDAYAEGTTNLNTAEWLPYSSYWTIQSQKANEIVLVSQGTSHGTVAIYNSTVISRLSTNTTYTFSGYLYRNGQPWKDTDQTLTPYNGWVTTHFESRDDGFFSYTGYFANLNDVWIIHTPLFGAPESGVVCVIKDLQIEQKDHATPYVNGTRPNGLIYDNSGYGYNGIQNGSLQILEDSTNGKYSAKFDSNIYVDIPILPEFSEVTYSFWIKIPTNEGAYRSIFNVKDNPTGGLWLSLNTEGVGLWSYYAISPSYSGVGDFIPANTWINCVFVFKDGYANWYKNGEYMGRNVFYPNLLTIPSNHYCLGDSFTGSSWDGTPFNGQISDFKIFATALSAEDVLAEYNRKASIDRNGNVFCGKFEEVNSEELLPGTYIGTDSISVRPNTAGSASQITNTSDGSLQMTNQVWGWSPKFDVNYGETLYFDIEFSNVQNDLLYIGFEQFDDAGNSGSNELCWYVLATADAHDHARIKGTMTIGDKTDANTNVSKWRLRLLNDWNGVGGGMVATIHHLSLRRLSPLTQAKVDKKSIVKVNSFREDKHYSKASFTKDGFVFSTDLIEN